MSAKKKVTAAVDKALSDSDYREIWAIAKDGKIDKKELDGFLELGVEYAIERIWPRLQRRLQLRLDKFKARWNAREVVQARRRTGKIAVRARKLV